MQNLTDETLKILTNTSSSLDIFGELSGLQWSIKRSITENIQTQAFMKFIDSAFKKVP
jgi:hypothetical protein